VVFPDSTVLEGEDLGSDGERRLVIDRTELRDLAAAVLRLVGSFAGERKDAGPGREAVAQLRLTLFPTIERRVPLAEMIYGDSQVLERLTERQRHVLKGLERNSRVLVDGPAGTGKTVLAVHHAHRLAARGLRVLFVCFNKGLAAELSRRQASDGVTFTTFHRLCMQLADEAGIELSTERGEDASADFWEHELPEAMVSAIAELGPRFDALVIDEAQDFAEEWFQTLTLLLEEGERSNIWIFRDPRQSIHRDGMQIPAGYVSFDLAENCRNTKAIHREACGVISALDEVAVLGPPGRKPERVASSNQPAAVAEVLARLCRDEEIPPQDIVVLSAHGRRRSRSAPTRRRAASSSPRSAPSRGSRPRS
jgi:superfamily I DNA/RNA helicase